MVKNYVLEKGIQFPLCAVENGIFFDYFSGEVITNKNLINFIQSGLKCKTLKIVKINLIIYEIGKIDENGKFKEIYYNFIFNGYSNYLNNKKNLLDNNKKRIIMKNIISGEYIERMIWGE